MSEELVSALLDGECESRDIDRLLAAIERDPSLRAGMSRMQFARESSRGLAAGHFDADFADRVMATIGDELPEPLSSKVVPLRRRTPAWVPATAFAAAASVVAVVTASVMLSGEGDLTGQPVGQGADFVASAAEPANDAVATVPVGRNYSFNGNAAVRPVSLTPQMSPLGYDFGNELRWAQIEGDQARQLNNYLIDYSNYRSAQGVGGTLGYARFAAHTADYRPQGE